MNKVYDIVTKRILDEMQSGIVPWEKPWIGSNDAPRSYGTNKPYSLLNQMLLRHPGKYITYRKLQELGGTLKKGAIKQFVVFWKMHTVKDITKEGEEREKDIPVLRYYNVYNVDCCDGLPQSEEALSNIETISEDERNYELEYLKDNYLRREGIALEYGKNLAYYAPEADLIHMPEKNYFLSLEGYYSVFFHEIVHSTGHKQRLNRFDARTSASRTTKDYAYNKEELVAELASSFLLQNFGMKTDYGMRNSASYIASWAKVFKNDPNFIISAASKAEKAVNFILNYKEKRV